MVFLMISEQPNIYQHSKINRPLGNFGLGCITLQHTVYFKCQQQKGETVNDWWVCKTNKARECNLEDITADDIRLLELIRGVHSVKLRQEFFRTKDPTLDGLLGIARNWQVASKVEKGMETPPS